MNPFEEKVKNINSCILTQKELTKKPYLKDDISPYTKARIILMNGTEFESVWFMHNFHRHCNDEDIRRKLALVRRNEQQQQKAIASLKPINESLLESTIAYEQLAVDLTAHMAERATDLNFKQTLDFALLEDFDHLYRYANLLKDETGIKAEYLVGKYTEIMPGRPTVIEPNHPFDTVKPHAVKDMLDTQTMLHTHIITAAEQQTMNYYMNQANHYTSEMGRRLYSEIAMIEEQHVTEYGSLLDPNVSMLECNLVHEFTECYLYYSVMLDEENEYIKSIWERFFELELSHLHEARLLLEKYENKSYLDVIPDPIFPDPITLNGNIDYVRKVIDKTLYNTAVGETYMDMRELESDSNYFKYLNTINKTPKASASHQVIDEYILDYGMDYRFETKPHPVECFQDRSVDIVDMLNCE